MSDTRREVDFDIRTTIVAFKSEEEVHRASFCDIVMQKPKDLLVALLKGLLLGPESRRVVGAQFIVASSSRPRTHIVVYGQKRDSLRHLEELASRAKQHVKYCVRRTRHNAEAGTRADDSGSDVQARIGRSGYPFLVDYDKLFDESGEGIGVERRERETIDRALQARHVLFWTKEARFAIGSHIRLT